MLLMCSYRGPWHLASGLIDDLYEGVRRVILLVMDGMGWMALHRRDGDW